LPLEVDPALGPYDFKAYSYYQSTDAISTTDIDPTTSDLIWGETLNQAIDETETGRTVTILLKHCFSKVRVKLSVGEISNATITGLGSVTIGGSETVNLDVEDGSLSLSGTAMAQTVGGWVDAAVGGQAVDVGEPFSETALWSEYCLSYASLVKVTIYNIKVTVGGTDYAYSVLSTSFTEALSPGRHYTLVVDLKQIIFASSNIYWDATLNSGTGGLRFLASGGSNYQGVFFLWGSLVGVSPYGGLSGGYVGSQVYVYSPNINDGTWTRALAQDHPLSLGSSMTGGDYTNRGENYLYDHPDFANYKGDICSYLSGRSGVPTGNWRMPNAAEFGVKADYSTNGWITVTVSGSTEVQQAGMGTTSDGRYYNATSVASPWFPVGGCRSNNVLASSNYGYFWSGTPASTTTAYNLYMGASAGISIDPNPRYALHYPVRCVKI
jgi:hypothetical protein